jgi:hypothetical protein
VKRGTKRAAMALAAAALALWPVATLLLAAAFPRAL